MRPSSDQQQLVALIKMASAHFKERSLVRICHLDIFELFCFKVQLKGVIQRTLLISPTIDKSFVFVLNKQLRVPDFRNNQPIFQILLLLNLIFLMVVNEKIVENFIVDYILPAK